MGIIATDEVGTAVDRSSEFDQTAVHNHVDAGRCLRCNEPAAYAEEQGLPVRARCAYHIGPCEYAEPLPFVSKTREAMAADVLRLDRDRIELSGQLRDARDLVRQTQEDMSELCVLYARTGIELSNAEFRIKHLKTLAANGATITVKDLDGILNRSDADAVPEYRQAA